MGNNKLINEAEVDENQDLERLVMQSIISA